MKAILRAVSVSLNINKGHNHIKGNLQYLASSFDEAVKYNVAVSRSLHLHEKRQYFFDNYQNKRLKELCSEILGDT